ncbi:MAG TPA: hypothetical protein VE783_04640 [Candidatus Limnocylindrales bacterium]|nr:hypothetical protein [Candidatus Limnocylindrales bacterium]
MQVQRKAVPIWQSRTTRPVRIKGGGKSRPHSGSSREKGNSLFTAGDLVRETGIYEVVHDAAHRVAHEVVMLSGDAFPPCDTCEQKVRFRLVRTAPYIFQDEDFAE